MLFKNKYRIKSDRLEGWDYSNAGAYFITICTHNRIHHFGKCQNGQMQLSTIGLIVQGCWFEIPRFNPQVQLGSFIVMPNHVHGILILDEMGGSDTTMNSDTNAVETLQCNVSTMGEHKSSKFYQKISPEPGSISTIIRSFKSACTKHINKTFPNSGFKWQARFHDHIIRNEQSYHRISNYINNNPKVWKEDRFY